MLSASSPVSSKRPARLRTALTFGGVAMTLVVSLPLPMSPAERMRFAVSEWPNQLLRMASWRAIEATQQRFPGMFGRKPDARMIVEPKDGR